MPLCGFNEKMIDGIKLFSEGIIQATLDRGRDNGVSDDEAFATELRDIELFTAALRDRFQSPDRCPQLSSQMVFGIAVFAHGLFSSGLLQAEAERRPAVEGVASKVREITEFLGNLEAEHQRVKANSSPELTALKAVEWMARNDASVEIASK